MKHKTVADSERGLFFSMQNQNRWMFRALMLSLTAMVLVTGYAFFSMAVRTDKVILLDASGQPQLASTVDDQVFKSEAQFFIRKVVEQTYSLHYGTVVNPKAWADHLSGLEPYYAPGFFPRFVKGLKDAGFFQSIADGKLILSASVKGIKDVKRLGEEIIGVIELETNASAREGTAYNTQKLYEVKLRRGTRTLQNPWGLYVHFLAERG